MKKGLVMEKHRNYMIVMQKDGTFQKAHPVEHALVGMEVSYQPLVERDRNNQKRNALIAAVACLLLVMAPFYFTTDNDKTYAYVNITINPNLELEIDNQLNVKSIEPLNEDAKSFLPMLTGYKGKQLETVIQQIITKSEKASLLKNGKNILAGVSYTDNSQQKQSVTQLIDEYFGEQNQSWGIVTFKIPKEIHEQSLDDEQSMNELMARNLLNTEGITNVDTEADTFLNNDERDIIHSFYNIHHDTSGSGDRQEEIDDRKRPKSSEGEDATKSGNSDQSQSNPKESNKLESNSHSSNSDVKSNNSTQHKREDINGKAKGHDKAKKNNGKAKGHDKAKQNNGKAKGHDKAKQNNGKAKGHDKAKQNNGKAKGHDKAKQNNGKAKSHDKAKQNNGKSKGHDKAKQNNGKAKGHDKAKQNKHN
ncbi:hypothetical protein SAMN05216238_10736 [Lentibacillus persicus]|uniref:RsgI N-terminal anti-sigma domain-containing protein n=1 Tax=Lentibacillus persicus TaxID=640948 RepID=A0A1I1WZ49_9BACI|nr:hypothetical protein [Lentibacillus persicus]SFE00464.1 hypothetical protein SAMN05216238_10736 [Lentibacillus persicus]